MDDGSRLLTGPGAGPVLSTAVRHTGGEPLSWTLEHVDANPNQSTTATYLAKVPWPYGERMELLGVLARGGELSETDRGAEVFGDDNRGVAVWIYPVDPDLSDLKRAAYPEPLAALVNDARPLPYPVTGDELELKTIGHRPRRRAAARLTTGGSIPYIKAIRVKLFDDVLFRHRMLTAIGVPAPRVAHVTSDQLIVFDTFQGKPLTHAIFDPGDPCTPEQLTEALGSMPPSVAQLERRPPWSDAVQHYVETVSSALPEARGGLKWAAQRIRAGPAGILPGIEPTHGDSHESQVHVTVGRVVGIFDADTIGPGRRAGDLACLTVHLSTTQRVNPAQEAKVRDLLARWVSVFDRRVGPVELRLRAAAAVISLATGLYRSQKPNWQESTRQMIQSALVLVRQAAG